MKEKRFYILLFVLISLLLPRSLNALEVKDFTFQHLGIQEGLSSQRVYSLYQSSDGAIWWTTKNGVDRSNGSIVNNYSIDSHKGYSRLAGRVVKFAHNYGKASGLYVFDNTGRILLYNKIQDRFDEIANITEKMKKDVVLNDILVMDNTLWLALREGVYRMDISGEGSLTPIDRKHYSSYIMPLGQRLLLCTSDGVFSYNINGKKAASSWLPYDVKTAFYDQSTSRLWLGTFSDGVKVVNMKDPHYATSTISVPKNPIRAIRPYGKDRMLIGVDGFGVYETSRLSSDVKVLFSANDGKEGVLHGNGVYDILVDSWNDIVIGSYSGGIDIARPVGSTTAIFRHVNNMVQSLGNNHVNCVRQSGTNELLMGTDDGVSIFNSQTSTWRHTAKGMVVLDICKKPSGGFLLATYGNGVCDMNAGGSVQKAYSVAGGTLKDDHVYRLCYDKAGNLWMGTLFGSLTVKTPGGMKDFPVDNIFALCPLSDGRMAVGTSHGLYFVSLNDKAPHEQRYMPNKEDDANRFVVDLCLTSDNLLWIATDGGGVYIYNVRTGKTEQITKEQGLPSNSVTSLTYDGHGRIWFGTEKGLAFAYTNKPHNVVDVNYCFGLNAEYCQRAVTNLANGDILYGTVNGAIIISPKMIQQLNYTASLNIRGVRLHTDDEGNAESTADDDFNEKIAHDLADGTIHLSYGERSFDVCFESINFRNQFDIAYQYRMGDMGWSPTTDQQYISFENLEPGKHVLYIRSISKTSGKVLDEKVITIYVARPWWNSWWMWCFYLLLLALAFQGAWWMYQLHSKYMRLIVESVGDKHTDTLTGDNDGTIANTAENSEDNDSSVQETAKDEGTDFISRATKIVLDNLKDNDFTIDDICREIGMSRTLFYVKVKTYTGKSPQDFVRAIRLERAGALLRQNRSVSEVSVLTGFDNPKYFSTVFKKYFGVSPSKFK